MKGVKERTSEQYLNICDSKAVEKIRTTLAGSSECIKKEPRPYPRRIPIMCKHLFVLHSCRDPHARYGKVLVRKIYRSSNLGMHFSEPYGIRFQYILS